MSDHAKTLEREADRLDVEIDVLFERDGEGAAQSQVRVAAAIRAVLEKSREQEESLRVIHSHNHEIIAGLQREKNAVLEENERLRAERKQRMHAFPEGSLHPGLGLAENITELGFVANRVLSAEARVEAALAEVDEEFQSYPRDALVHMLVRMVKALRGEK